MMCRSSYLDHLTAANSRQSAGDSGPCGESIQSKESLREVARHSAPPLIMITLIYLSHTFV